MGGFEGHLVWMCWVWVCLLVFEFGLLCVDFALGCGVWWFGFVLVELAEIAIFGFGCRVVICLLCRLLLLLVVAYATDVVLIALWFITPLFCDCVLLFS